MHTKLARIQKFAREMKEIQEELLESVEARDTKKKPPMFEDPEAMKVLSEIKATVDDFRRILFFHVRNLSMELGVNENSAMQEYRLRRATELLEVLSRPPMFSLTGTEQQSLLAALERLLTLHGVRRFPAGQ